MLKNTLKLQLLRQYGRDLEEPNQLENFQNIFKHVKVMYNKDSILRLWGKY